MPKAKTVGIQEKPEVDLEKLEALAQEEARKADEVAKQLEEEQEDEEMPADEEETPKKPVKEEEPAKPETDYKKKFTESQKEAMILAEKLRQIEEEKSKKIEITDEFLQKKYPEWNEMTTGEQRAIKKAEELEQQVQEIKNNANQFNNDRKWVEKVDEFINEELLDAFPKMAGKEDEFKRFATKPTRKGLPLDDLAKIFLFENPEAPTPKKSLFHAPGASGTAPTEGGLSADDIRDLRVNQPLKYMRLVKEGKLKIKI